MLRPALVTVALPHFHVGAARCGQGAARMPGQFRNDLDGVNPGAAARQDGSLVAGPRTDFQDLVAGPQRQFFRHVSDNIRLGYGLAMADGAGMISVRIINTAQIIFRDESMPRHFPHCRQDRRIGDAVVRQLLQHRGAVPGVNRFRRAAGRSGLPRAAGPGQQQQACAAERQSE